ncbi:MAG: hypothetical protein Q8Q60_04630 [Candidatus Chromulinivorax sp.]|nr:hypothetical protein [Candidatus Chromulinivorax sp.]
MNFLLSIFILFLSHATYSSEPQQMKRSDSTDTVEETFWGTVDLPIAEHNKLRLGERKYLKLKLATVQGNYLESTNQMRALNNQNSILTTQLQTANTQNNLLAQLIVAATTEKQNLTTLNSQLHQQLQDYQNENEELENLSCSIVGPRFYTLLCCTVAPQCSRYFGCKSQALPKYIELRKGNNSCDNITSHHYYYYDTKTNVFLSKFQGHEKDDCDQWCWCCGFCCCCIKSRLPYHVGIRQHHQDSRWKEYYDTRNNATLEEVVTSGIENCYINCCRERVEINPIEGDDD